MIIGAKGCGKTEIANYIEKQRFATVINYEKFIELKKKQLGTEDEEMDEIPFPILVGEFKKELD